MSSVCKRDYVVFYWIGLVIVDTYVHIDMSGLSISLMNSGGAYIQARTTFKMFYQVSIRFLLICKTELTLEQDGPFLQNTHQ